MIVYPTLKHGATHCARSASESRNRNSAISRWTKTALRMFETPAVRSFLPYHRAARVSLLLTQIPHTSANVCIVPAINASQRCPNVGRRDFEMVAENTTKKCFTALGAGHDPVLARQIHHSGFTSGVRRTAIRGADFIFDGICETPFNAENGRTTSKIAPESDCLRVVSSVSRSV